MKLLGKFSIFIFVATLAVCQKWERREKNARRFEIFSIKNLHITLTDNPFHRSLQWLRGPNKNIELELETIRSNVRAVRPRQNPFQSLATGNLLSKATMQTIYTNIKSVLKNVRIIKPVSITCGLMVFQRFTGNAYTSQRLNCILPTSSEQIFLKNCFISQGLIHLVSMP